MGSFEYKALDAKGRNKKGIITADTLRQARQKLRELELLPLEVSDNEKEIIGSGGGQQNARSSRYRISDADLALITRQFAVLLDSGLTIEDCLKAMIGQSETHQLKSILTGVNSNIMEGQSLGAAFSKYPKAFSELYVASVSAGEQTGKLTEVMERLADYIETRQSIKQRVGVALIYPIILLLVAIVVVAGLVTYVVPRVVSVFADTGQELPGLTIALIALSDFLRAYGLWIVLFIVAATIIGTFTFRHPRPKKWLHGVFLMLPGIRRISRGLNSSKMARTLAIMAGSGVPLLTAMQSSAQVIGNLVMRAGMTKAAHEVAEGASVNRSLERANCFPPLLIQMVASGESSGQLSSMLEKAASATERELENRLAVLVGLFEPLMILIMGGIVMLIVLAILLPIFDLNQLIT